MASLWSFNFHWRKNWYCNQPHSYLVHLYFASHHGLTHNHLHGPCFFNEYQKIYHGKKTKPDLVFIAPGKIITEGLPGLVQLKNEYLQLN